MEEGGKSVRSGVFQKLGTALTPACAALLVCAHAEALEVGNCSDFKPIDTSRLPSEDEARKLCQLNSDAAADKYEVDTGMACEQWSACRTQYKRTTRRIHAYNSMVQAHCQSIEKYNRMLAGRDSNQAHSFENTSELYKNIKSQKQQLAQAAKRLAAEATKNIELNEKTIAKYEEDRTKLTILKRCVKSHSRRLELSGKNWSCARRLGKRRGIQISEAEVVEMQNGTIDPEMGGASSWAEYEKDIDHLIEEQETAKKLGEWAVLQLREQAALQESDVATLNSEIKVVKESSSSTSSLGNTLATGNQAMALGGGLAGLGNRSGGSGNSHISSGASSMPPPKNLLPTNNREEKGTDPFGKIIDTALNELGTEAETNRELLGIEKNAGSATDNLGKEALSDPASAHGLTEAGTGSGGIKNGGAAPEGFRTLAGFVAEKKGKAGGAASGASRLAKDDGEYQTANGAKGSTTPGAHEPDEENTLFANFSGQIKNQVDGLDGQSEIANILDQMQDMFGAENVPGAADVNANAAAATNGFSRNEEIARFERTQGGDTQGATMAHESEELMNFSLFSRVHLRHRKSMEKGLVIFGLRHRVN